MQNFTGTRNAGRRQKTAGKAVNKKNSDVADQPDSFLHKNSDTPQSGLSGKPKSVILLKQVK